MAAKTLFDATTRDFHLPSAQTQGAAQARLLENAASGYERLLKQFPDQSSYAAQAQRSLGNVRVAQGRIRDALTSYDAVAEKYPTQEWEILQAWKTAGDLLWERGNKAQARVYYGKIVTRFEKSDLPAVAQIIVRSAKKKWVEPD